MPLFRTGWSDGSVSTVLAKDKEEAVEKLAYFGEVDPNNLVETDHFVATFTPVESDDDDADWEASFDEQTDEELSEAVEDALEDEEGE